MTWSLYAIVNEFRGMNWAVFIVECGWHLVSLMMDVKRREKGTQKQGLPF